MIGLTKVQKVRLKFLFVDVKCWNLLSHNYFWVKRQENKEKGLLFQFSQEDSFF